MGNRRDSVRIVLGCGEYFCLRGVEMKYEITKGSEKDFDGGLSGCTHVYDAGAGRIWCSGEHSVLGSFRLIAERRPITEPVIESAVIGKFVPIEPSIHRKWFNVLTREPSDYHAPAWQGIKEGGDNYHVIESAWKFEPSFWSGEGLPPIGALCRYRAFSDMPWVECKVLAWHDDEVWLKRTKDGKTFTLGNPDLFPIRSPEDVARDEFIKELSGTVISGISIGTNFAAALYDAGYRKME